jgi:hypothetical protein
MLLNALVSDPKVTLICFGVILTGIPVYLLWKGRGADRTQRLAPAKLHRRKE